MPLSGNNGSNKNKLDSEKLKRLSENSPARRLSLSRMANNVIEAFTGGSNKNGDNNRNSIGKNGDNLNN